MRKREWFASISAALVGLTLGALAWSFLVYPVYESTPMYAKLLVAFTVMSIPTMFGFLVGYFACECVFEDCQGLPRPAPESLELLRRATPTETDVVVVGKGRGVQAV